MPRENSFTDSDGRSLTPDPEDMYQFSRGHEALDDAPPTSQSSIHPRPVNTHLPVPGLKEVPRLPASPSKHSHWSKATNLTSGRPWNNTTPKEKFRTAVRKIIAMRRSATLLTGRKPMIGAEPGVDPRRASADVLYSGVRQECVIEIVDYSAIRCSAGRMSNTDFISLMEDPSSNEREPWVKVRWINIGGLSWDVIKALSMNYGMFFFHFLYVSELSSSALHPLALEDVFHARKQTRSKADYYPKHLFLQILCHELQDVDDPDERQITGIPRSNSPEPMSEDESSRPNFDPGMHGNGFDSHHKPTRKKRRLFPHGRLRDLESMLDPHDSRSSFARLLGTEGPVRLSGSPSGQRFLLKCSCVENQKESKESRTRGVY
jgi:hypothetical protein